MYLLLDDRQILQMMRTSHHLMSCNSRMRQFCPRSMSLEAGMMQSLETQIFRISGPLAGLGDWNWCRRTIAQHETWSVLSCGCKWLAHNDANSGTVGWYASSQSCKLLKMMSVDYIHSPQHKWCGNNQRITDITACLYRNSFQYFRGCDAVCVMPLYGYRGVKEVRIRSIPLLLVWNFWIVPCSVPMRRSAWSCAVQLQLLYVHIVLRGTYQLSYVVRPNVHSINAVVDNLHQIQHNIYPGIKIISRIRWLQQ